MSTKRISPMERLADSVMAALRGFVESAERRIMGNVEKRFKDLPAPRDGKDGRSVEPEDVRKMVGEVVAALELRSGEDGREGPPGKDAPPVDLDALKEKVLPDLLKAADDKIANVVAQLPSAEEMKGEPGDKGEAGPAGPAGESVSAEQVAVQVLPGLQAMAKELIETAVSAIPDPEQLKGPQGERGPAGESGVAPTVAEVAEAVLPTVKEAALVEVAKIEPRAGKDADPAEIVERLMPVVREQLEALVKAIPLARDGRDGAPGRDAAQVEVMPALDEKRVYPRSTFAQHKGGLWRSHKTTEGMLGWDCIVRGVDSLDIEQDAEDPRLFRVVSTLSDGTREEKQLRIPAVIDRGVFKDGEEYQKGDGVTWARHYWIAKRDTKAKPDGGDDWRLAVKSGRDGRDGKDGKDGERGPRGEPGKIIGGLP